MPLNKTTMLDLSTAHLSAATRVWMDKAADEDGAISIMKREEGFFVSSVHGKAENAGVAKLPADLAHVLRFASLNDVPYVLFDRDAEIQAELPVYEDNGMPRDRAYLGAEHDPLRSFPMPLYGGETVIFAVGSGIIPDDELRIREERILEDGDYIAPDGLWLTVGSDASVRVKLTEENDVVVNIYPLGRESGDPIDGVAVEADLLAEARRAPEAATEPDNSPF